MAITKTIGYTGETRKIRITGNAGAKFGLYVKQGSNYYNWNTGKFQSTEIILKFQEIPSTGGYTKDIVIPEVVADTSYDFYINALPGTISNVSATHTQKIGTLYQKGPKKVTFNTTSAASLVIQNSGSAGTDLTGGTLANTTDTLNQTGTITKAGSPTPLIYVHATPSHNKEDGGNWTNSKTVTATVDLVSGTKVVLTDGTNISSGDSITGDNIIDEITVSAISGNTITLSTAQNLSIGQTLIFSKSGWTIGPISAKMSNSGTTAVTMNMDANVAVIGIADVACACVVDSFVSVKPNAFPVSVDCPAGGEVLIKVHLHCTNYLGQRGDNDATVGDKTFTCHSIPTAETTSSVVEAYGTLDVAADAEMGGGEVTYTAADSMVAGDTDYFYYKCVDDQGTPVASSTTQGKISITIV